MFRLLTLDTRGILLAAAMGMAIFVLGGGLGPLFLGSLVLFLFLSAAVTRVGKARKQGIGVYEAGRGWKNVAANGAMPLVAAFLYWLNLAHQWLPPSALALAYLASVCAITADKFASEIGVLDGEPIELLTLKRTKRGVSGGVTAVGLLASLVGSGMVGLCALGLVAGYGWLTLGYALLAVSIATVCGFLGNMVDSILGYFEERGTGNKFTSNFFCSVAGFVLCALLVLVIM
jgi:uncharacterized protein (TIGR00297 family)